MLVLWKSTEIYKCLIISVRLTFGYPCADGHRRGGCARPPILTPVAGEPVERRPSGGASDDEIDGMPSNNHLQMLRACKVTDPHAKLLDGMLFAEYRYMTP